MSQFIYLLNAFELATQANEPAAEGYAAKRQALLEYVERLESRTYVSSDAQDAARYRWMRSSRWYVQVMSDLMDRYPKFCVIGTELDAAIDAELAKCFISRESEK